MSEPASSVCLRLHSPAAQNRYCPTSMNSQQNPNLSSGNHPGHGEVERRGLWRARQPPWSDRRSENRSRLRLRNTCDPRKGTRLIQALVLAAMIAHQLGMKMARLIGTQVGRARLSYEKLYDDLVDHLLQIRSLVTLDEFDPDFRHIKRDKRKRKSPIESGILALI